MHSKNLEFFSIDSTKILENQVDWTVFWQFGKYGSPFTLDSPSLP